MGARLDAGAGDHRGAVREGAAPSRGTGAGRPAPRRGGTRPGLARALTAGGADVRTCPSNPLSPQDDVAAALVRHFEVPVFAIKGEDKETYYRHIARAIVPRPQINMDDAADPISG